MSTPACCSTGAFLGKKMCDFLHAHRHLRAAPCEEWNKCPLFSQPGLCKDRWPHADFFFFFFPGFFSSNCFSLQHSRLPWEQLFTALLGAEEEGQGWGLFARRGQAGVSLYNSINAGTGSNRVQRSHKMHQVATSCQACKVPEHLWGEERTGLEWGMVCHPMCENRLLLQGSKAHKC